MASRTLAGVRFISDGGGCWFTEGGRYAVIHMEAGLTECEHPHPIRRRGYCGYCEGGQPHPYYAWMAWDMKVRDYAFNIRDAHSFAEAAGDLASWLSPGSSAGMMRVRVGVSGGITVEPETAPDPAPREGDIMADPNRLLTTAEVCALIDTTPETWRSYVKRGYAPQPDDPDEGRPANRRMPRWKLSTIAQFQHTRVRRKKRNPPRKEE